MKSLCGILAAAVVIAVLALTAASAQDMGQGGGASQSRGGVSITGTYEIALNFANMKQAAVAREIRWTSRCINNARERLRDIQGNINRLAQTDLLNCQRRMQQLVRIQADMTRQTRRVSFEADAAGEFAQQRLRNTQ